MGIRVFVIVILLFVKTYLTENTDKKDLVLIPSEKTENSNDDTSDMSFKDENDFDVFEATHEWQAIKEGQAIPQGLHVQMNLQTGEKKAKLMDEDINQNKDKMVENLESRKDPNTGKQKLVTIDENLISKQKLKALLKDFKDKFKDEDLDEEIHFEHEKNKYRSMEEIKKEFEGANVWMKKDIEIIQELVDKMNNSDSTKAEILESLDDLEYYVHQIDNARDLDIIGGFGILMKFLNQTEDNDIKSKAAFVIGGAAQSNLPVQASLLDSGVLSLLIRELSDKQSPLTTRKNILYALSSVLRIFPKGTQRFLKIGGLSVLSGLFQENGNDVLRIKSLTLLVDLLTEQISNIRKKAKEMGIQDYEKATVKAPLFKALFQDGWCELTTTLLTTTDNETREKTLLAIDVLFPVCKTTFRKNNLTKGLKKWRQEWHEINMDNEDDTGYIESLVKLVDMIVSRL